MIASRAKCIKFQRAGEERTKRAIQKPLGSQANTITRLLTKEEKEFSARKVLISWRLLSAGREALLRARCYSDLHTRRTVHTADVILSLAYHTLVLARYSRGVYSELFTGDLALYTMARKNSYTQNIVYGEYKIKVQKQCQWL